MSEVDSAILRLDAVAGDLWQHSVIGKVQAQPVF